MTHEVVVRNNDDLKNRIINLIESNMSAISLIAEQLDVDELLVRTLILEAVAERKLSGNLTTDESRFYRSDVKMPTIKDVEPEEFEMPKPPSLLIPKVVIGSGIGLFIAGQILIRLSLAETTMYNISTMFVFGGLVTIIAGLCTLTRISSK